jgi:electron transport complex protein RnfC
MPKTSTRTFLKGGVHPPGRKDLTASLFIEAMPLPPVLRVPLAQHFGKPATALVKPGERVEEGQIVGEVAEGLGAAVHAPAAGTVLKPAKTGHPMVGKVPAVVLEVDPETPPREWPEREWRSLDPCDIVERVRAAGVVGMGGAGFPTHVKLCPPPDLRVDTVLVNGAECESYLTADHRLLLERPERIVEGARILLAALRGHGAERCVIGIEANKDDALQAVRNALEAARSRHEDARAVSVRALAVRYPQGAEKQLVQALTGRRVPAGGLPAHAGCLVQNAATAHAVYEAVALGRPCYERVLTVSGLGVGRPANLLVRAGTPLQDVVDHLGGVSPRAVKCVLGGPMMGFALAGLDNYSATKTTSGLLLLTEEECEIADHGPCIRCGRCLQACPMGCRPNEVSVYMERGRYRDCERFGLWDCYECGSCAYVCPAKRPLVQFVRTAKTMCKCRA